jgi:ubiquinone/menaquinone biosynthesis C-methylase UbiE
MSQDVVITTTIGLFLQLFEANTFDLVHSWLVLQHMPKPLALAYISEFARVAKPGGVIVFQIPDPGSGLDLLSIWVRTVCPRSSGRRNSQSC